MSAIFIILLLLIAAASFAIYLSKRLLPPPSRSRANHELNAPPPVSLFGERAREGLLAVEGGREQLKKWQSELLARAAGGDTKVLHEAHATADRMLYNAALDLLVTRYADNREALRRLASEVTGSKSLRANRRLAEALIESWRKSPSQSSLAEMLHVAALSDEAAVYDEAVDAALQSRRANAATRGRAEDFCELVESQFWVLGAEARASGAGFVLKERLAAIRRELAAGE